MRVAFAVEGEEISAHFGHCAQFALVDLEDGRVVGQHRVDAPPHQHDAPCALPPYLQRHGAQAVVA
ncbi:MAG: NifB/NifX family molybdenum-iron cluster-binding protein, partial [Armatimonadota bacterium]|nr:NifB/NifX family molybdenum-iron cluster-binding protein [Armatimonadota bacterium]